MYIYFSKLVKFFKIWFLYIGTLQDMNFENLDQRSTGISPAQITNRSLFCQGMTDAGLKGRGTLRGPSLKEDIFRRSPWRTLPRVARRIRLACSSFRRLQGWKAHERRRKRTGYRCTQMHYLLPSRRERMQTSVIQINKSICQISSPLKTIIQYDRRSAFLMIH